MSKNWRNYSIEIFGSALISISVYNFAAQAEFPMTGFTGISLILFRLFGIPLGVSNILLNVPVVFLCYKLLGKEFLLRSFRCMLFSSIIVDYIAPFFPVFDGDRLLAAICTGVLGGIGYALIYMQNTSTGGADFLVMAIKVKKPHVALGNITFLFAVGVILVDWIIFRNTEGIIYALIINYISGVVINRTMYRVNAGKLTMIVTKNGKLVSDIIEKCCHRGSTIINVVGGYQGEKKQLVFSACSNKQMYQIQTAVKSIDPDSFMVIWEANEIRGNGFQVFSLGEEQQSMKASL